MYRKVISLIAISVLLLFSVAASSPYIMGDGNTLTVTLPVDQIEFVNVIFIGDEQFVAAAESDSGNVIPVPGSDGLVLQASSLRSKGQLELSYNENEDKATNVDDRCYVFYRLVGDKEYKITFADAEGLSIDKEGVRPIEFYVSAGDASYNTADASSDGSISISGTSMGIIPLRVETETIDGAVGNRPAGKYSGSLTLSVQAD